MYICNFIKSEDDPKFYVDTIRIGVLIDRSVHFRDQEIFDMNLFTKYMDQINFEGGIENIFVVKTLFDLVTRFLFVRELQS